MHAGVDTRSALQQVSAYNINRTWSPTTALRSQLCITEYQFFRFVYFFSKSKVEPYSSLRTIRIRVHRATTTLDCTDCTASRCSSPHLNHVAGLIEARYKYGISLHSMMQTSLRFITLHPTSLPCTCIYFSTFDTTSDVSPHYMALRLCYITFHRCVSPSLPCPHQYSKLLPQVYYSGVVPCPRHIIPAEIYHKAGADTLLHTWYRTRHDGHDMLRNNKPFYNTTQKKVHRDMCHSRAGV